MPIYEYECGQCGQVFEEIQSGFDEKDMECPRCGGVSKRMISNTSFVLKGSGWYVTDYGGNKCSSAGDGNGNGNGDGNGKGNGNGKGDGASKDAPSGGEKASPCASGCCPSASKAAE